MAKRCKAVLAEGARCDPSASCALSCPLQDIGAIDVAKQGVAKQAQGGLPEDFVKVGPGAAV